MASLGEGAMRAEHVGQRVKVCWPGPETVYGDKPAYVTYDASGYIVAARSATDAEVQWWLTLKESEQLRFSMESLTNKMNDLITYGIRTHSK